MKRCPSGNKRSKPIDQRASRRLISSSWAAVSSAIGHLRGSMTKSRDLKMSVGACECAQYVSSISCSGSHAGKKCAGTPEYLAKQNSLQSASLSISERNPSRIGSRLPYRPYIPGATRLKHGLHSSSGTAEDLLTTPSSESALAMSERRRGPSLSISAILAAPVPSWNASSPIGPPSTGTDWRHASPRLGNASHR